MRIVDAHHHIWRQADLPWLKGPMVPRIFGPYEAIRRDYTIGEFLEDLKGTGVDKSVYVQTNWPKEGAVEEAEWVQGIADEHGWPHAIVGYVDLLGDEVAETLKKQAASPLMCGVRMQLHWHANEMYRFAANPDLTDDATLRRNLRRLTDHGWSFDLQVFPSQMAGAARLAADNPDITFILLHAGMLEDLSEKGRREWREGMKRLAGEGNIVTKLSALGTFIHRNDPAHIADIVHETVEIFGTDRCLFGSNFPVEKLWTGYAELVDAHRAALASYPADAQEAIFAGNAERVYRI